MTRATHKQFHFRDLLVNFFHELNDEIHKLVFKHLLCVKVGDQE